MKVKITFCVLASLLLSYTSEAALQGKWPEADKPPPPVAEWTALVDKTKVINAPLMKAAGEGCPAKDTYCNWSCTGCTRNDSDVVKCPTQSDWGITYDDGPTPFTTKLLDYLDTMPNVKVTFFVIGSRVMENPEILQRAVKAGHQIGIHTWSHPALTTQSTEQVIAELKWTEKAIIDACGLTPKYMRPPFGDYDDRVRSIATQLGYKIVIWDEDTNDWMSGTDKTYQLSWVEGNFTQWVKESSQTGHVSLEHDLYQGTVDHAITSLPIVTKAGFNIKTVAQCTSEEPYTTNLVTSGNDAAPSSAAPASAPATAPAASSSYGGDSSTSSNPSYAGGSSTGTGYLVSGNSTNSTMTNGASLNTISLWSFVSLIVGSFMFI